MREGGQTVFEVRDYMYTRLDKQHRDFVGPEPQPAAQPADRPADVGDADVGDDDEPLDEPEAEYGRREASDLAAEPAVRRLALQQPADLGELLRHQLEHVVEREDAEEPAVEADHRQAAKPTCPHVAEGRFDTVVLAGRRG